MTRRLLKAVAKKEWPLERFIDPARGVVLVDHLTNLESGGIRHSAVHCCGECLTHGRRQIRFAFERIAERLEKGETGGCKNTGANPECWVDGWDMAPSICLVFVRDPARGVVLEGVLTLDELTAPAKKRRREANRVVARAREKGCPR